MLIKPRHGRSMRKEYYEGTMVHLNSVVEHLVL
jgi:hypothetical protein